MAHTLVSVLVIKSLPGTSSPHFQDPSLHREQKAISKSLSDLVTPNTSTLQTLLVKPCRVFSSRSDNFYQVDLEKSS